MTNRDGNQDEEAGRDELDGFEDFAFSAMTTGTMHIYRVLNAIRPKRAKKQQHQQATEQPDLLNLEQSTFVIVTITSQGLAFSVGEMHTGLGKLRVM